jgi:hypothetical protein
VEARSGAGGTVRVGSGPDQVVYAVKQLNFFEIPGYRFAYLTAVVTHSTDPFFRVGDSAIFQLRDSEGKGEDFFEWTHDRAASALKSGNIVIRP